MDKHHGFVDSLPCAHQGCSLAWPSEATSGKCPRPVSQDCTCVAGVCARIGRVPLGVRAEVCVIELAEVCVIERACEIV